MASEDYCENELAKREIRETSNLLKVDEHGQLVYAPLKPVKPDTSKWKRMTPKRQGILSEYRKELKEYLEAKKAYDEASYLYTGTTQDERLLNDTPRIIESDEVAVFEFPCGRWHKGYGGNQRRELPYDMVEHHQMEIKEFEEGNWVTLENYDSVWRAEEWKQMRKVSLLLSSHS